MIRHLFVPGLFGPMPAVQRGAELPRLPRLETLLARADQEQEAVGHLRAMFQLFGIETAPGADIPSAPVCYLADVGVAPDRYLLHADPLHLRPDQDRLLAFDLDDQPLSADDREALVHTFNEHFREDGVQLITGASGALYLGCAVAPRIQTQPLHEIIGRNIDLFLPQGDDQRQWRSLLNETQMLLHGAGLNEQRVERGAAVVSGLWFSGGGNLPVAPRHTVGSTVGDDLLPKGLGMLREEGGEDQLIVQDALEQAVLYADVDAWIDGLQALDARLPELSEGCDALHLHPGNGVAYVHARSGNRRFWRRKRPLVAYLQSNPAHPRV